MRTKHLDLIGRCRGIELAETEISTLEDAVLVDAYIELLTMFGKQIQIVGSERLGEFLSEDGLVVFEPAQSVLLDRWRGFMPYCTPSVCTFENADQLLGQHDYDGEVKRLGITRAYMVRHGPGPFVSEDAELTERLPDTMNGRHQWQRSFRVGWLDVVALRYAIACCGGVDALAVTCLDRLRSEDLWLVCDAYDSPECTVEELNQFFSCVDMWEAGDIRLGPEHDLDHQRRLTELLMQTRPVYEASSASGDFNSRVKQHLKIIERELKVPVAIASFGPTADDKHVIKKR